MPTSIAISVKYINVPKATKQVTMASTMTMKQGVLSRQAFTSGSARTARRQPRTVVSAVKVHTCATSEIPPLYSCLGQGLHTQISRMSRTRCPLRR